MGSTSYFLTKGAKPLGKNLETISNHQETHWEPIWKPLLLRKP